MINWRNFDLILFDMDGTLANSEPLHNRAICLILDEFHCLHDPQTLAHQLRGCTDLQVYQELCKRYPSFEQNIPTPKIFLSLKNNYLENIFPQANWEKLLTPGAIRFLEIVKSAPKKLGLVSASDNPIVDLTLKSLKLTAYFDLIIGNQDVPFSKPHPAPYLQAMAFFKTAPRPFPMSKQLVIFFHLFQTKIPTFKIKSLLILFFLVYSITLKNTFEKLRHQPIKILKFSKENLSD